MCLSGILGLAPLCKSARTTIAFPDVQAALNADLPSIYKIKKIARTVSVYVCWHSINARFHKINKTNSLLVSFFMIDLLAKSYKLIP